VIAADECYSEIYIDEAHPPLGALEAAYRLGRGFDGLILLSSLSKRSNVPGLRSGFAAGDASILRRFIQYRTYHGSVLSPVVQAASVAGWNDETHVRENRVQYAQKFKEVLPVLTSKLEVALPEAGFYLWAKVEGLGMEDTEFAARLFAEYNVTVLPGSYLSREVHGINPGRGYVRLALVSTLETCLEGAKRIADLCDQLGRV
jgi:N-succinyldiaminopimelate aminotransferase